MTNQDSQFEEPLVALRRKIEELEGYPEGAGREGELRELRQTLRSETERIFSGLSRWQKALLARHPDRREALARGARRRASDLFTWDQHAERLLEVYWQTLYPATPLRSFIAEPRRAVASTAPEVSTAAPDAASVIRPTLSAPVRANVGPARASTPRSRISQ